jgi:hypothetical protein
VPTAAPRTPWRTGSATSARTAARLRLEDVWCTVTVLAVPGAALSFC